MGTGTKLELKRKEVADKYEATVEKDVRIHTRGYSGMLSNINLAGADNIVKDKNVAYVVEKATKGKTEKATGDNSAK